MLTWLVKSYFGLTAYRAGLTKDCLPVDDYGAAAFSYYEKGVEINGKPSIVFVHGFASTKNTWIPIIQNIPSDYHCIAVDLPAHGETIGLNEEQYSIDKFAEKLKLFFDKKGLTEPMCLVGASLGGAIAMRFALKYPSYVSTMCLLAPPANEECETELIKQVRQGTYNALLPETLADLENVIDTVIVKKTNLPRILLNSFLQLRLVLLEEQKKVLTSLIKHDYPNYEQWCQVLRNLPTPTLILWGRQDRLCTADGADFLVQLLPNAEKVVLDDCGHFMAMDKPEETAEHIMRFFDRHCDYEVKTVSLLEFD